MNKQDWVITILVILLVVSTSMWYVTYDSLIYSQNMHDDCKNEVDNLESKECEISHDEYDSLNMDLEMCEARLEYAQSN